MRPRASIPRALVVLAALASASCSREPAVPPLIVAHRGASHDAPENTLAAFRLAWERGADLIEGDFHMTADGRIVAHHDDSTKRTAGLDRPIASQTLEELRRHDVGSWKHERWAGERIPTLEEVLAVVPADKGILVEVKCGPAIVPTLLEVIAGSGLRLDQAIVISFDEEVVAAVESARPELVTLWVTGFEETAPGVWTPTMGDVIETALRIGADGIDVDARTGVVDEAAVAAARAAGLALHVWTINDPVLARRMRALGVDGITTDRPGWLRDRLAD